MQILSAASAWFAAALPAILLMYILKKNYTDTEIASNLLWQRVLREQEANRPWQRLRSRLLMLVQLLVAALLVFALMEPVLLREEAANGHVVLLIDRSGSMSAAPSTDGDGASLLAAAIGEAEKWIDEQAGNRPVSIVVNGASPETLSIRERDRKKLKDSLGSIGLYYGYSDNVAALSFADSLHRGESGATTIVFMDGHWSDAAEANALPLHSAATVVPVGGEFAEDNAAILSFGVESSAADSLGGRGTVTIRNDSPRERTIAVDIIPYGEDGSLQSAIRLETAVPPHEWRSVQTNELPPADYYEARLSAFPDNMASDNIAFQFPETPRAREALIVSDGNLFLEKALQLAGVKTIRTATSSQAPAGDRAQEIDWIVADGSYEKLVDNPEWAALLAAKPLWIIDHPAEGAAATVAPQHARTEAKIHPVTAYITLEDTHISKLHSPDAAELAWGEPVLTYGGIPAIYAGHEGGLQRLRFTFSLQDSDLPLRPEFPVLIVQAAEWMNGGDLRHLGTAFAGQPLPIPLHSATTQAYWEAVRLSIAQDGTGAAAADSGGRQTLLLSASALYEAPIVPGLYRLVEQDAAGRAVAQRYLAVAAHPAEWQSPFHLQPLALGRTANPSTGEAGATGADGSTGPENGLPEQGDAASATDNRQMSDALQLWIVALLLLLMAAEWEVYRRGH